MGLEYLGEHGVFSTKLSLEVDIGRKVDLESTEYHVWTDNSTEFHVWTDNSTECQHGLIIARSTNMEAVPDSKVEERHYQGEVFVLEEES